MGLDSYVILWVAIVLSALSAAGAAQARDPSSSTWSPRDEHSWSQQAISLSDVVVEGIVLTAGELRSERFRGHLVEHWCWTISVTRVYFAASALPGEVEVCAIPDDGRVPAELASVSVGGEVIAFSYEGSDGYLRLVENVGLATVDRRTGRVRLPGRGDADLVDFASPLGGLQ